jgi:hypothetical protein
MSDKGAKAMGILVTGGDWAAALRDLEVLADVCMAIWQCVKTPMQIELVDISRACRAGKADEAVRRWATISAHLRAHLIIEQGTTTHLVAKA